MKASRSEWSKPPGERGFRRCEPVCKPDSVTCRHRQATTIHLGTSSPMGSMRPTRGHPAGSRAPAWPCTGWGLPAVTVAGDAGGLLHHRFTLACPPGRKTGRHRRSALCCTFRRVTPPGSYPAPCPAVSGLSSVAALAAHSGRPTGSPVRFYVLVASQARRPVLADTGEPSRHARDGDRKRGEPDDRGRRGGTAPQAGDYDHDESQQQPCDHPVEPM
jgi:hypothetical protein